MKKIILVLVVSVLVAPASAAVNVTAAQTDVNEVTISYSTDANLPRAFALEIGITADAATLGTLYDFHPEYYVYPGSIQIAGGVVTDYGTPIADQDSNSAILEMGSLYAGDDPNHKVPPPSSGVLCRFTLNGCGTATVTLGENAERGGVVMENPYEEPALTLTGCPVAEIAPLCWCYVSQCYGDGDGIIDGSSKAGYYHVGAGDLTILLNAYKVKEPPIGPGIATIPNGICADFAHDVDGSSKAGYYHVGASDLTILLNNYKVKEDPFGPGIPEDCGGGLGEKIADK